MSRELIKKKINAVKDFPEKGRIYYDITSMLSDAKALRFVVDELINYFVENDMHFDKVVSAESRGFIFGAILARELRAGFVPISKKGKLPTKKVAHSYEIEAGRGTLEIHEDSIELGDSVLIIDDLLGSGNTALTTAKLVEKAGGIIKAMGFLIELSFLKGRSKLKRYNVFSLIDFEKPE